MGILGSMLGRREPHVAYRTVDGGHPAPFPDMTDEQLYNYEMAFNVPRKTFDQPPPAVLEAQRRAEAAVRRKEKVRAPERPGKVFDAPRYAGRSEDAPNEAQNDANDDAQFDAHNDMRKDPWSNRWNGPQGEPQDYARKRAQDTPPNDFYAGDFSSDTVTAVRPTRQARTEGAHALDLTKPVRTITTKQPVDIITTRARHPVYKVHAYIGDDDVVTVFTLDGRLSENGPQFLENVPQKQQLHLNIYRNREPGAKEMYLVTQHATREDADAQALAGRITCVAVQFDL